MDVTSVFGLILGGLLAFWAHKRGYAWWAYLFASPVIGAIALNILPNLNEPGKEYDNKEELVRKGNTNGLIISGLTIAFFTWLAVSISK